MCAYHIPGPVRETIERLVEQGTTNTATIAGHLHGYEFAVEIQHRIGVIEQVKQEYREANPLPTHSIADEPLTDDALETAVDASPQ